MAKAKTRYICQECSSEFLRWSGRCSECGNWNTLEEQLVQTKSAQQLSLPTSDKPLNLVKLQDVQPEDHARISTGLQELDRVLGSGIVPGSLILLGGEPGIGKSTLLMQMGFFIAETLKKTVIYVTGEESGQQVKLRAQRMGLEESEYFYLLPENDIPLILQLLEQEKPTITIIDSIQAVYDSRLNSPPGSISQVKNTANAFLHVAKRNNVATWLIGHVNKDGDIAGPKVLEHTVDTVLYFEGERYKSYRLLRTNKNRFGATNEVGVFEMSGLGLTEVLNPSKLFLAEFDSSSSGSAIISTLEGTRPLLVEIQALCYSTYLNFPKRSTNGVSHQRLIQILAVLEKKVGLNLSKSDVLVNVVSGLQINEPGADLGIAMAVVSSVRDIPIDRKTIFIGEVGLGGEVRNINQIESRLKEAVKLGFNRAIVPASSLPLNEAISGIKTIGIKKLREAILHIVPKDTQ